jgi:hypothetical protein
MAPANRSAAGKDRSPAGPTTRHTAPQATRAPGTSDCGRAETAEPPTVAWLRSAQPPVMPSAMVRSSGAERATSGLASSSA